MPTIVGRIPDDEAPPGLQERIRNACYGRWNAQEYRKSC